MRDAVLLIKLIDSLLRPIGDFFPIEFYLCEVDPHLAQITII